MRSFITCAVLAGLIACGLPVRAAEVCNLKIVTDASPDYTDLDSMVYSITNNWSTTKDKCWAIFYWNHIVCRQTFPMMMHGNDLGDPIRQFNDYGYTQCSTIAGINCTIWNHMGLKVRYWDISNHTVPEVFYDDRWHMYDNSLSTLYTLCNDKTIAGVEDIGKTMGCDASGGKEEPGHIAKYHCLDATSVNGFLEGSDNPRSLEDEYKCFDPAGLKYRYYWCGWEDYHRYALNVRENETYTRNYHSLGQGKAYYIPNWNGENGNKNFDPDQGTGIRGNGEWDFRPDLSADNYKKFLHDSSNLAPAAGGGLRAESIAKPGVAIFRTQSANVTTSQSIHVSVVRMSADDSAKLSVSTDNGETWKEVWQARETGPVEATVKLVDEVNGTYDTLIKVELTAKAAADDAVLKGIEVQTITMVNSKTLPRLNIGKNEIYLGAGEQTESLNLWPDTSTDAYKLRLVEAQNISNAKSDKVYYIGFLHTEDPTKPGYVVYKLDAPRDMTSIRYGGRFHHRFNDKIEMFHSFDNGKTWINSLTYDTDEKPWDKLYQSSHPVPAGVRSVLFKFVVGPNSSFTSYFAEADVKPVDAAFKPLEVTFKWKEREGDYSLVERSHTQLVDKLPFRYEINVGGADHPQMEAMTVRMAGDPATHGVKYGYSDGNENKDAPKWVGRWVTYGKNFAEGKPYTVNIPSRKDWGAGDPKGNILTDGIVGSNFSGGSAYTFGALWTIGDKVEINVDLGQTQKCGVFRMHWGGYPVRDALKGEIKDKVEILTSVDGKEYTSRGVIQPNMRWKDLPANFMWPDDEQLTAYNHALILDQPVEARYVKYKLTPQSSMSITEVQVLDFIKYEPFDLKVALPKD